MSILLKAHEIVFERKEEKQRQYGPMDEGMLKAARIASEILNKDICAKDVYICMVALKLSRESYNHKEDNILDAIAYLASYNSTQENL